MIATHWPIIMAYPEASIYLLDGEGIREVAYADTEHYSITRGFLKNRKEGTQAKTSNPWQEESRSWDLIKAGSLYGKGCLTGATTPPGANRVAAIAGVAQ